MRGTFEDDTIRIDYEVKPIAYDTPIVLSTIVDDNEFILERYGVYKGLRVPQSKIDPDDDATWEDPEEIRDFIDGKPAFPGPLCLNWEGEWMRILVREPVDSPQWLAAVDEGKRLLAAMKAWYPDTKVGYYAIGPSRALYTQDAVWVEKNLALCRMLVDADYLMPTMYLFHEDREEKDDEAYAGMAALALRMATAEQKVAPVIHHRYHKNAEGNLPYNRVPRERLKRHVQGYMSARYGNRRPDEIIVWHADEYRLRQAFRKNSDGSYFHTKDQWKTMRSVFSLEVPSDLVEILVHQQHTSDEYKQAVQAHVEATMGEVYADMMEVRDALDVP